MGERATAGFIVSLIGGIIDLIVAVILIGMASIMHAWIVGGALGIAKK